MEISLIFFHLACVQVHTYKVAGEGSDGMSLSHGCGNFKVLFIGLRFWKIFAPLQLFIASHLRKHQILSLVKYDMLCSIEHCIVLRI